MTLRLTEEEQAAHHLNGIDISVASNDDVYDLVMEVAGENRSIIEVAEKLARLAHRDR